jgi:hypothetical protein
LEAGFEVLPPEDWKPREGSRRRNKGRRVAQLAAVIPRPSSHEDQIATSMVA